MLSDAFELDANIDNFVYCGKTSDYFGKLYRELQNSKDLFTRTVSVPVAVSVKVYHCVNGDGPFDRLNGYRSHSDHHHTHNVNLTETVTETETVPVNRL